MTIQAQADPEIALTHGLGAAPRIPSNDFPLPSAPSESKLPPVTANATAVVTEEEMVPPESPHDDEIHNEQQSDQTSNNFQNNNINGNSRSWPNTRSGKWMMYAMITISFMACLIPTIIYSIPYLSTDLQHLTFPPVPAPVYVRSTRRPTPNFELPSRRPHKMWSRPTSPILPISPVMPDTGTFPIRPPVPSWPTSPNINSTDILENPFIFRFHPSASPVLTTPPSPSPSDRLDRPTLYPTYDTWSNPPSEGGSSWWLH